MGVFTVPVTIRTWQNRFLPLEEQEEEVKCKALVDSGAVELVLSTEMIDRLKLEPLGTVQVYTADGGQHEYRLFGMVELEVQARVCHVRAIELPYDTQPLLGDIPLEEMDWNISPVEKQLLPNPRSPEGPLVPPC